jgi:hypothetical protein|tara:strand:- start:46 stop:813 length:768 start_codon:yes stop_codon:yes gene_type:complete
MKKIFTIIIAFATTAISAQQVGSFTYLDVPTQEIGKFIRLHKQVTDMTIENREFKNHWLLTHFQGSGANVVIWSNYPTVEDVYKDSALGAIGKTLESLEGERKARFEKLVTEYLAYWNGHTDEIRTIDWDNNVRHSEDMDWDTRFFVLFGNYQTTGNTEIVGDAFNNWLIFPGIEDGSVQSGGFSSHLSGGGSDLQVWTIHSTLEEYVNSISLQGNAEGRSTFWENVEGNHSDNMFVHRGHVVDGKFDLAGPDKE